jgi:hypothetical protein
VFADWPSGLRSGTEIFGVTVTDGGLKLDGIGSGRLGIKTGVESFSTGGFGAGAVAIGVFATGVNGSRDAAAGIAGASTCRV